MLEQNSPAPTPTSDSRDWLAALLMRRQSRLMPRLALAFARLRAAPRSARRRLHRRAAVSLGGAALLLALSGSPLLVPPAHAATLNVANGEIAVNDNGVCSLIEAIINANDNAQTHDDCVGGGLTDTINLPAGGAFNFSAPYVYDTGNNGLPTITTRMTIEGNGSTLDLGGSAVGIRLARVNATGDLTVVDTIITGGYMYDATYGGGVFRVDGGELTIDSSTLSGNATRSYGGAIFALNNATLTIANNNSTIQGNSAFRGGGVYSRDSDTTIEQANVSGNYAERTGGGIHANGGALTITDSTIDDNGWEPGQIGVVGYTYYGGGALADDVTLSITDSTFVGNYAGYGGGGGLRLEDITGALVERTTITGNTSAGNGGGVQWGAFGDSGAYPVTGIIRDSLIAGNTAGGDGGGVELSVGELTVERTTVSGNTAHYSGGGISARDVLTIDQSAIINNTATTYHGGGLALSGDTQVTNSTISGNEASQEGGGVFVYATDATFNNVTISDNDAADGGGLMFYSSSDYPYVGSVALNRTIISGNRATGTADEVLAEFSTITAGNFNLFGHSGITNAAAFSGFTPGGSDITATSNGTEPTALAAILAPLADNGGPTTPATETHALVANSPALDRGPNAACTAAPVDSVDQRDVARNQNGIGAASANECDVGAYEYVAAPPTSICPAPGNEVTTILGAGMGSPKSAVLKKKLVVPNSADLVALYGQLVGKDISKPPRRVRFQYPGGNVDVKTLTGTSVRPGGIYWFGADLPPASSVTGRWFLAPGTKGKIPRAFLLYATHETTAAYFDTYVLFPDGATNTVGPEEPWAQSQTLTIPIDPPLAPADITVQVALVDNNADDRVVTVVANAGGVEDDNVSSGPTHGNTLNIITLTLDDVPAGTEQVTLEMTTDVGGESATIVGATANYVCNP